MAALDVSVTQVPGRVVAFDSLDPGAVFRCNGLLYLKVKGYWIRGTTRYGGALRLNDYDLTCTFSPNELTTPVEEAKLAIKE